MAKAVCREVADLVGFPGWLVLELAVWLQWHDLARLAVAMRWPCYKLHVLALPR